jgi:hypothetical protein
MQIHDASFREVWKYVPGGTVEQRLLGMRWTGESLELIVQFDVDGLRSIRVVNTETGEEREVASSPAPAAQVLKSSWSADGQWLALWAADSPDERTSGTFYRLATDGSRTVREIGRPFYDVPTMVSLSPDGHAVATVYKGKAYIRTLQ